MKQRMSVFVVAFFVWMGIASSQTFIFHPLPQDTPQLSLRYMRPNFDRDMDLTLFSGVYDLALNLRVSPRTNIVASIPISVFGAKDADTESNAGNLYIGFQTKKNISPTRYSAGSFGVYVPTAPSKDNSANFMGLLANYFDMEKYYPDMLTLYGNFAYRSAKVGGAIFGVDIGPRVYIPTDRDEYGGEEELFLHYGLTGGFQASQMAIFAELAGIGIITEDIDDPEDRFNHFLALGVQWTTTRIRPSFFYQIYLDDDMKKYWNINGVFGLKLDTFL